MKLLDGTLVYEDIVRQACVDGRAVLVWHGDRCGLVLYCYGGGCAGGNVYMESSVTVTIPSVEVALRVARDADKS